MISVPKFLITTVIAEPSHAVKSELYPLGILTWGDSLLAYYIWETPHKIVVYAQCYDLWLQQDDHKIGDSIGGILGYRADELEAWNMMLFDGPVYIRGVQFSENMAELFLDCEWS